MDMGSGLDISHCTLSAVTKPFAKRLLKDAKARKGEFLADQSD